MRYLFARSVTLLVIAFATAANAFSYTNENKWPGVCNNGLRQSPINIDTNLAVPTTMVRAFFSTEPFDGQVINTGHSIELAPDNDELLKSNTVRFQECNGGPAEFYRFKNCHIHWGQSEHMIDAQAGFAELHCVFQLETGGLPENRKFAVFGVILTDKCTSPDPEMMEVLGKMLASDEQNFAVSDVDLGSLIMGSVGNIYFYPGSLTVPPCSEDVQWIVSDDVRCISGDQKVALEKLSFEYEGERHNYRSVQKLNGRTINVASVENVFKAGC